MKINNISLDEKLNYEIKDEDSHKYISPSVNNHIFTAPITGIYYINNTRFLLHKNDRILIKDDYIEFIR